MELPTPDASSQAQPAGGLVDLLVPRLRRIIRSHTAASELRKARESDPKHGCCMISNESDPSCSIEKCYLVPRSTPEQLVSAALSRCLPIKTDDDIY